MRIILSFFLMLSMISWATAQDSLNEHLAPLKPFLGKTYKGTFGTDKEGKTIYDVSTYQRALNGQAVKAVHSLNDGEYGGETFIFWNKDSGQLEFFYFTTAGFYTQGKMEINGSSYTAYETVVGNTDGITEVKSTATLLDDGRIQVTSQYFKNGEWTDGRSMFYEETPDAKIIFK